jgi:predicted SAM-dependent methyltransferase
MKRLNLCSGQRPFSAPWINVDSQEKWGPDVVADCREMPMFEDNSADLIVIHHGAEHFGCGEANGMVEESQRILVPGGSLLIFVPDMRALAQRWLSKQITTQIYMTNVYGAYMSSEDDRHKWGYDYDSLYRFLTFRFTKWQAVKAFDWREIPGADIAKDWWILGMEAVK